MAGYQQTIVVGNVGHDPELKYLQSGTPVCNFSVAVTEKWVDQQSQERREKTNWYRVAAWGKLGENCNMYLKKGSQVMIVGNVEAEAYTTQAGDLRATLKLNAKTVQFLSNNSNNSNNSDANAFSAPAPPATDFPF